MAASSSEWMRWVTLSNAQLSTAARCPRITACAAESMVQRPPTEMAENMCGNAHA